MKKIRNMLISAIAIAAFTTSVFAGNFGVGVTGSVATVGGKGKLAESETGTETESSGLLGQAHNTAVVGSLFLEYTADSLYGMTIGFDYMPGEADIGDKVTRTDANLISTDDGDYSAAATLKNHYTVYAELPIHAGMYVKAGYTELDVDITTSAPSGNTYQDTTADAIVLGVGYKNDFGTNGYYKIEGSYTDFDDIKSTSTGTNPDSVTADIDVTRATIAIGYKF
jgi:hypothetical protein